MTGACAADFFHALQGVGWQDDAMTYDHPYPSPELEAKYPFHEYAAASYSEAEMRSRAGAFRNEMDQRRSVRMFSDQPVPRDLIEAAISTASTAPSGAHQQPWTWVAVAAADMKRQIRTAAEDEERTNYLENRMNEAWQQALAPIGTDWHKEYLEVVPWIVVLFEQRYGLADDGARKHHYYVKESCGIAAGLFITAIHHMGLATLTHTPSPMAFLTKLLDRPENERPSILFPIGYPLPGVKVPTLARKSLDEVAVWFE